MSIVSACIGSAITSIYFTGSVSIPVAAALFVAVLSLNLLVQHQATDGCSDISRLQIFLAVAFSALFSGSVVLGAHIHIGGSLTGGNATVNYISQYTWADLFGYIALVAFFSWIIVQLLQLLKSQAHSISKASIDLSFPRLKEVAPRALLIFVFYIPWLLAYWPGLFFGDTYSSYAQATGWEQLSNHHPVCYTLAMKVCLVVARLLGFGHTTGIALFTIVQMALMAACFGYLALWTVRRLRTSDHWSWLLVLGLGLSCYVAQYSVALWKDPLFSCALLVQTMMLVDAVLSKGMCCTRRFHIGFGVVSLASMLLRNNGAYISFGLLVVFVVLLTVRAVKGHQEGFSPKGLSVSLAVCIAIYLGITGPVYSALGVLPSEKVESAGIPLAQMARVVATNGSMTEDDRVFMGGLLPIAKYTDVYHPCLIDTLKWDPDFTGSAHLGEFVEHWVSMFLRNPKTYFEAWELQTFGYWAPNVSVSNGFADNIMAGAPYNVPGAENGPKDIAFRNLLPDEARNILSLQTPSVPGGILLWGVLFVFVAVVSLGEGALAVPLLPGLFLFGTLFLASPIWYWPRYIAAAQFCIPVYVVVLVSAVRRTASKNRSLRHLVG